MVKFQKYKKPTSPNGTSLFLFYFLYICLSITYSYKTELGIDIDDQQLFFTFLLLLSFPLLFWPIVNDEYYTVKQLPNALKINKSDGAVKNFFKKFIAGYYIGLTFPFLKFKEYVFTSKDDSELKKYKNSQKITYYIVPLVSFIILLIATGVAIYFNEKVINATNSVGIYLMGPNERTIYQMIFTLLLMSIIFSLVPNKMAKALDKTWNYYLMFVFCIINLIIINDRLNDSNTFDRKILNTIYIVTIILLFYCIYNLIQLSSENKEYRILTLGKINDEDRININSELFGIYDVLKQIKDSDKDKGYFDGEYFDAQLAKNKFSGNIDSTVFDSLNGRTRAALEVTMKDIDQTFINIYQARMSWEKSLRAYFKFDDIKDKKEIIDGFFDSEDFQKLTKTSSETLNKSAKDFNQAWINSRKTNQLPDGDSSRKVFGAATTVIGGNIAMGIVSSNILKDFTVNIGEDISLLFNRYMFQELAKEFVKVTKFLKEFKIYSLNNYEANTEEGDINLESQDVYLINNIKDLYVNYSSLLLSLVEVTNNKEKIVFRKNLNIFQNFYNNLNVNLNINNDFFIRFSEVSYRISMMILIYNYYIAADGVNPAEEDKRTEIFRKYNDTIRKLYQISKNSLNMVYNRFASGTETPPDNLSNLNFNQTGGDADAVANNINIQDMTGIRTTGFAPIDLTDATISYKIIKPLNSITENFDENLFVEDLSNSFNKSIEFLKIPEMLIDMNIVSDVKFQDAYGLLLFSYFTLIINSFTVNFNQQLANLYRNIAVRNEKLQKLVRPLDELKNEINTLKDSFNNYKDDASIDNRRAFNAQYNKVLKTTKKYDQEYFIKASVKDKVKSFVTNTEKINTDIKFFKVTEFPPEGLNLDNLANDVPYKYEINDSKDLKINEDIIDKMKLYYKETKTKGLIINDTYKNLTTRQKNTIISTEKFKEIYEFYFPEKNIKNTEALTEVFNKFKNIYDSYNECLLTYLVGSVDSSRMKNEKNVSLKIKQLLEIINQGFPEVYVNDYGIFGKEDLTQIINLGELEVAGYTEIYNDKKSTKELVETAKRTAIAGQSSLIKTIKDATAKIEGGGMDTILIKLMTALTSSNKGNSFNIPFENNNSYLKVNHATGKLFGTTLTPITSSQVFNMMTKILLTSLSVLTGDTFETTPDKNIFLGNDDKFKIVPFLTRIIMSLYMSTYADSNNNNPKNDEMVKNNMLNLIRTSTGGPASSIGNGARIFYNGNGNYTNNTADVQAILGNVENINVSINSYDLQYSDFFKSVLKELNKLLSENYERISSDKDYRGGNVNYVSQNTKDNLSKLVRNSYNNDNIFYYILMKVALNKTGTDTLTSLNDIIQYLGVQGNFTAFRNNLLDDLQQKDQELLIAMIKKEYYETKKQRPDESGDTLLKEVIINNPFLNSLKIIT